MRVFPVLPTSSFFLSKKKAKTSLTSLRELIRMTALAKSEDIVIEQIAGLGRLPEDLVRLPADEQRRLEEGFSSGGWLAGPRRQMQLFNGHYLEVEKQVRGKVSAEVFNLAFVDPVPLQYRCIAHRWLIACALALVATGALVALWSEQSIAVAAGMGLVLVSALQAARGSRRELVYLSCNGRVPLFSIGLGWPASKVARQQATRISERAEGARVILPGGTEGLAAEIAEHRRLLQAGCITRKRYEKAKRRLFAGFRMTRPNAEARARKGTTDVGPDSKV